MRLKDKLYFIYASKKAHFLHWFKTIGFPWIKKNKIAIIVIALSLFAIIFLILRMQSQENQSPVDTIKYKTAKNGISGEQLKKILLTYDKKKKKAAVVIEQREMILRNQEFMSYAMKSREPNKDNEIFQATFGDYAVYGINYGRVIDSNTLQHTGEAYYTPAHFVRKAKLYERYDGNKLHYSNKERYHLYKEDPMGIPDDEYFLKQKIVNASEQTIGYVYKSIW
ncbi:hypothetical protein SAMN05216391_109107 [Lachnospiraceae bacterium KHCPX20]|nr:hypothetical protein SAMN05216391_109107 [Lachnospiraceae bacterium KHCPX20]